MPPPGMRIPEPTDPYFVGVDADTLRIVLFYQNDVAFDPSHIQVPDNVPKSVYEMAAQRDSESGAIVIVQVAPAEE